MKKFLLVAFLALVPLVTKAQVTFESIGETLGLGGGDLESTTINILRLVLGYLVLVAFVFFLLAFGANYLWSGASEPVHIWARRAMIASLVGLIIVLLAWAIVSFVANTTVNVTQP